MQQGSLPACDGAADDGQPVPRPEVDDRGGVRTTSEEECLISLLEGTRAGIRIIRDLAHRTGPPQFGRRGHAQGTQTVGYATLKCRHTASATRPEDIRIFVADFS